jgi:hypothetical protein
LGVNREIKRTRKDFTEEELENWPSVMIAINNDPQVQKIAIEIDDSVFFRTSTVANILETSLNQNLEEKNLTCDIEPTFEKKRFWETVKRYPNQIRETEFFMVSPNLSEIAKSLNLDLDTLHKTTNTKQTTLSLQSDKASNLTLSMDDEFISSLVDYSSKGGGNITIKIKGLSKSIKTAKSVTRISVDEMEFTGLTPPKLISLFMSLLHA